MTVRKPELNIQRVDQLGDADQVGQYSEGNPEIVSYHHQRPNLRWTQTKKSTEGGQRGILDWCAFDSQTKNVEAAGE